MEYDVNVETIPDIETLLSSWRRVNISMINVMMEEVYLAEHIGGAMTQKWKFREGFLQEVALEL